jgi:hypothetical protein
MPHSSSVDVDAGSESSARRPIQYTVYTHVQWTHFWPVIKQYLIKTVSNQSLHLKPYHSSKLHKYM